jgi:hypothetical protein
VYSVAAPSAKWDDETHAVGHPLKTMHRNASVDAWIVDSITPTRFEVIPEFKDTFSTGGPKAWFVVVERN